ncbi:MAG: O-antigen ligase family protein, partial [Longimicrobiales bacterium]
FWRSPNKVRTASGLALGGIVFLIAVNTMLPEGTFAAEFNSIFEEGTTEGTGEDRWIVWGAALEVWRSYPITGVGLGNFGITAANHFGPGELGGMYATNPNRLAGMAIHNDYIQILSEMGILGLATYGAMLFAFFRNGRRLRTKVYGAMWQRETGGGIDLSMLSLAFEAAMIALLIDGVFYPQLDKPWFWALMILQFSIYHNLRDAIRRSGMGAPRPPPRPRSQLQAPGLVPAGSGAHGPGGVPALPRS